MVRTIRSFRSTTWIGFIRIRGRFLLTPCGARLPFPRCCQCTDADDNRLDGLGHRRKQRITIFDDNLYACIAVIARRIRSAKPASRRPKCRFRPDAGARSSLASSGHACCGSLRRARKSSPLANFQVPGGAVNPISSCEDRGSSVSTSRSLRQRSALAMRCRASGQLVGSGLS